MTTQENKLSPEYTRAIALFGTLKALQDFKGFNQAAARDEITRTIRRIHKNWNSQLTLRLQNKLSSIGVEFNPVMTTSEIYRLNRTLRRDYGVDRIIHVEHMAGGVKSISDKLMQTDIQSVDQVLEIIESMTFMAARLLVVEDHLCESTTIKDFNNWNNSI
jgi:hypothetical protein